MILIADNLQITNQTVNEALHKMQAEPIQALVKKCEAAGAHMIDINAGPLKKDGGAKMAFLVETVLKFIIEYCAVRITPILPF